MMMMMIMINNEYDDGGGGDDDDAADDDYLHDRIFFISTCLEVIHRSASTSSPSS